MKNLMNLRTTLFLGLILTSCSAVEIQDGPFYSLKGKYGARMSYLRDKKRNKTISQEGWQAIEFGKVCADAAVINSWKKALIKFCSDNSAMCYFYSSEIDEVKAGMETLVK